LKHVAPSTELARVEHALPAMLPAMRERAVVQGGKVRLLKAGEMLFHESDERRRIFVIESGWLKVSRTLRDGQRQIVGFPTRGSILGFEAHLDYLNDCEALTTAVVHSFPLSKIVQLCREPHFSETLLRQLGAQLGDAQTQLASVGAQLAHQKTAAFLMSIADSCVTGDSEFTLPMRRSDIGEFLGLRLETVSRTFGAFRQHGWISLPAIYRCRITDHRALGAVASGARTMKSFPLQAGMIGRGKN
jgi:CRP-like cAMP-binding protein